MAPHDDRTAWLVKAGARGAYCREFVTQGLVTIGSDWPGIGDLAEVSDADVFVALENAGRRKPQDDLVQLRMFSGRMSTEDIVVTPDPSSGDVLFGAIVGEYGYTVAPMLGEHHHGRIVDWFGRVAEDDLEPFLVKALTLRGATLRRLPEQMHWLRLAGEVRDGRGRPADAFPRSAARVKRGSTSRTSTPRTRTPAKPEPVLNPDRVCSICGLLRSPAMFVDGADYCRDCD